MTLPARSSSALNGTSRFTALPRISNMPKSALAISGALLFHEIRRSLPRRSTARPSGTLTSARTTSAGVNRRRIDDSFEIQEVQESTGNQQHHHDCRQHGNQPTATAFPRRFRPRSLGFTRCGRRRVPDAAADLRPSHVSERRSRLRIPRGSDRRETRMRAGRRLARAAPHLLNRKFFRIERE